MTTASVDSEILTLKQVADYLKVTERTIYRLAAARKIPAFKVGGTWRFSKPDLELWIRHQSAEAQQSIENNEQAANGSTRHGENT